MKRNMILFLLFAVFIGCEKICNLEISDAIKGGCFLNESGKGESLINSWPEDKDTVTYQINGDNLEIFLGFNAKKKPVENGPVKPKVYPIPAIKIPILPPPSRLEIKFLTAGFLKRI